MGAEPNKTILMIIGTLGIGGGAAKVAVGVGNELIRRGYEVRILTFYSAEHIYPFTGHHHQEFETPPLRKFEKVRNIVRRVRQVRSFLEAHPQSPVVSFLEEANLVSIACKLLFPDERRVIVSIRNNVLERSFLLRYALRLLYSHATTIVSVTHAIEFILRDTLKLTNVTTIHNPLEPEKNHKRSQHPLPTELGSLFQGSPVCITVGRLIPQKGHWSLIRAFTRVTATYPAARLIVVGEGRYRQKLEALVQACGLEDSVFLIGQLENVFPLLARSDLFVFSSLWEGMPNAVLEAVSLGVPVVSTDCVSGPREILAPEISVSENVAYPYRGRYGTLTKPLGHKPIFDAPEAQDLSDAEIMIADEIIYACVNTINRDDVLSRGTDFGISEITDMWENILISNQFETDSAEKK